MGEEWNRVRREYRQALAELTQPAKPVINSLTITADKNKQHASAIVQALESQLSNVRPHLKLPLVYLMDSILKNVGGIYIEQFSTNLVQTFMTTYDCCDPAVREKLLRVLGTWPSVFPAEILQEIHRRLNNPAVPSSRQQQHVPIKVMQRQPTVLQHSLNPPELYPPLPPNGMSPPVYYPPPPPMGITQQIIHPMPTVEQHGIPGTKLMNDIQTLLAHKRQTVFLYPSDTQSIHQIATLEQLLAFVKTQKLTEHQQQQISRQVINLWPPDLPRPAGSTASSTSSSPVPSQTNTTNTAERPYTRPSVQLTMESIQKYYILMKIITCIIVL